MVNPNLLCPQCMKERPSQNGPCPFCQYDSATAKRNPRCLPPFTILHGRYLIGTVLGEGGFGITYRGYDLRNEQKVAIKEFFPNGLAVRDTTHSDSVVRSVSGELEVHFRTGLEKYENEARCLMGLRDAPGVVKILNFFRENSTAYIVMEFLEGPTLRQYLKKQKDSKLPEREVLELFRPVLESLEVVHKAGVIHRDISPDNIILQTGGTPKLIDFGAARQSTGEATQSLTVILKHGYAPPEQYSSRARQGPFSDIYALCATMYRCLTGITPPDAMSRRLDDELKPLRKYTPRFSDSVCAAVDKGMKVLPEHRFRSVQELLPLLYPPQKERKPKEKKDKKTLIPFVAAGCAALLLVGGVGAYLTLRPDEKPQMDSPPSDKDVISDKGTGGSKGDKTIDVTGILSKPKEEEAWNSWQDAYGEFLRNLSEDETFRTGKYSLYDLDDDGNPELILRLPAEKSLGDVDDYTVDATELQFYGFEDGDLFDFLAMPGTDAVICGYGEPKTCLLQLTEDEITSYTKIVAGEMAAAPFLSVDTKEAPQLTPLAEHDLTAPLPDQWTENPTEQNKEAIEDSQTHQHEWKEVKNSRTAERCYQQECKDKDCPAKQNVKHKFDNDPDGDGIYKCKNCGYEEGVPVAPAASKPEEKPPVENSESEPEETAGPDPLGACKNGNHVWGAWKRDDAQRHYRYCKTCNAYDTGDDNGAHQYGEWIYYNQYGHNGICTVCRHVRYENHTWMNDTCYTCGEKASNAENCTHEADTTKWVSAGDKGHGNPCKTCGELITTSVKPHTTEVTGDGDASGHNVTCTTCGYTGKESHSYTNTNWTDAGDKHKEKCDKCAYVKEESHSYGNWSSAGETGHTRSCKCGKKQNESHTFSGRTCTVCGYKKPLTTGYGSADGTAPPPSNEVETEYGGELPTPTG